MDLLNAPGRLRSWRATARLGLAVAGLACLPVAGLVWSQATVPSGGGPGGRSLEYQVKAAYLLNFTRYVDWPSEVFDAPAAPMTICVLGQDPFGPVLDATVKGKVSHGRSLTVRRIQSSREASGCHVVFVSRETWRSHRELLESLRSKGLLTVGETDEFAQKGGVIGFIIQEETVRFVVNTDARDRAGLRISSRMLSLAAAVYGQRST
ncbi:MAG TPA: YfiR family protein [Gemmatimonadales bacterium]|nr:YfiR family protein [Gemmatimonadales bacterium]